jgi:hypothetical protein
LRINQKKFLTIHKKNSGNSSYSSSNLVIKNRKIKTFKKFRQSNLFRTIYHKKLIIFIAKNNRDFCDIL